MTRHALTALLVALLAGCATSTDMDRVPRRLTVLNLAAPLDTSFRFKDNRSEAPATSPVSLIPSPPEIVKAWLQQSLSEELRGKTVQLESFNFGAVDRSNPYAHVQPPAANVLASLFMGKLYFVSISGKVGDSFFYVYESQNGLGSVEDAILKELFAKAHQSLLARVANAARSS